MRKYRVSQMVPGYILSDGTTILAKSDFDCPRGKIKVKVRYPNGSESVRQWNKSTEMYVR